MLATIGIVLLVIFVIVLIIGVIRVMITPPDSFIDGIMQIIMIDCLIDILEVIFSCIGDLFD